MMQVYFGPVRVTAGIAYSTFLWNAYEELIVV